MGKDVRSRRILNTTVHPSIAALLFLLVTAGAIAGLDEYKTNIISHYDDIVRIAESQPIFPKPEGSTAGVSSDTSETGQDLTQPTDIYPSSAADTQTTGRPDLPASQSNQNPPHEGSTPGEPTPDPEAGPPDSLLCLLGICL